MNGRGGQHARFSGDQKMDDKISGAHGHTGHRIGEWHGRAKHSDATVRRARELYAEVGSYKAVGDLLGVPEGTVADWIRRDTRWGAGG